MMATFQVLGCLLKNPAILKDVHYPLDRSDFPQQFHKILFAIIENKVNEGQDIINVESIEDFLKDYPEQHEVYSSNNGSQYVADLNLLVRIENFHYYYNVLKKYSLLRALQEAGIDISEIYDIRAEGKTADLMTERFSNYSLSEIADIIGKRITDIKERYLSNEKTKELQFISLVQEDEKPQKSNLNFLNIETYTYGCRKTGLMLKKPEDYNEYVTNLKNNLKAKWSSEKKPSTEKIKVIRLTEYELSYAFDLIETARSLEGDSRRIQKHFEAKGGGNITLSTVIHKIFDDQPCYIMGLSTEEEDALQPIFEYLLEIEGLNQIYKQR